MSPGVLRELLRVKRALLDREQRYWYAGALAADPRNPLECFLEELPMRRHYEAMEREEAAFLAAGNRSVCSSCGERAVRERVVATLGGGLPGSEYSVLYDCDACGQKEL